MPTMLFTALKNYAGFSGRARRKEYWQFVLLTVIIGVIAGVIESVLGLGVTAGSGPVSNLANLALLVPSLAVSWRRMHDVNKPGWLTLLPFLGLILLFAGLGSQLTALATGAFPANFEPGPLFWLGLAIMIATGIYLFILYLTPGTQGSNDYGPDPKGFEGGRLHDVFR